MPKRVVVFTGHRKIADDSHKPLIRASVRAVIREGADEMVFGGADGFDLLALHEAWIWKMFASQPQHAEEAKAKYPKMASVDLVVVVPATLRQQPERVQRGFEYYKQSHDGLITLVEMGLQYTPETLKRRNHVMVDRIPSPQEGMVMSYWSGEFQSGTYSLLYYASGKRLPMKNIFPGVEPPPWRDPF